MPGAVERLDHALELAHLVAGRGVERVRREVADARVAPVVRQPAVGEEALVDDVVHRQQLDRRHAERRQVRDRVRGGEPAVRAAQIVANAVAALREALRRAARRSPSRSTASAGGRASSSSHSNDGSMTTHFGIARRRVRLVDRQVGVVCARAGHVRQRVRGVPVDRAVDRLRVRVDQQLRRVEAAARSPARTGRAPGSRSAGRGRRPGR